MRRFAVNLETKYYLPTGGNSVVVGNSTGAIGKVVINDVNQGGVDVS